MQPPHERDRKAAIQKQNFLLLRLLALLRYAGSVIFSLNQELHILVYVGVIKTGFVFETDVDLWSNVRGAGKTSDSMLGKGIKG